MTAKRAAQADVQGNLLPPEFSERYRNQFIDRLWMGAVGSVIGIYLVGVVVYFIALYVLTMQKDRWKSGSRAWVAATPMRFNWRRGSRC